MEVLRLWCWRVRDRSGYRLKSPPRIALQFGLGRSVVRRSRLGDSNSEAREAWHPRHSLRGSQSGVDSTGLRWGFHISLTSVAQCDTNRPGYQMWPLYAIIRSWLQEKRHRRAGPLWTSHGTREDSKCDRRRIITYYYSVAVTVALTLHSGTTTTTTFDITQVIAFFSQVLPIYSQMTTRVV